MENQENKPRTYAEIIAANERYEELQKQIQKCLYCVWGNPIDDTIVCAFPHCVNEKGRYK